MFGRIDVAHERIQCSRSGSVSPFVCVEVLRPSQPNGVMSSAVSLPNHTFTDDDDDEFRLNDASTHEGHLRQNGELTWFCSETIIMISHKCIKCKTRTTLKI